MAQRLMICRALMHEPRLLILDEPTTGLDPQSRLFLWDAMVDLRARGVTLILTTHDMAEADRLCDRIAIVDHGSIIALDTPRGLRSQLPAEHGLEVIVDAGKDPSELFAGLDWVERVSAVEDGDRWQLRLYGESARAAADALAAAEAGGRTVHELRRIEGTLEDVFVHLTGRELR
jgi:ABC-2 type transport system ATP-binding protein